jgi:hypothetical protein
VRASAARYAGAELQLTTASERNTSIAAVSLLMGDQGGYSTQVLKYYVLKFD